MSLLYPSLEPGNVSGHFKVRPLSVHYLAVPEQGLDLVRLAYVFGSPPKTTRPCCVPTKDGGAWRLELCSACFGDLQRSAMEVSDA